MTIKELQLLRQYIHQTKDDISFLTIEEVESVERAVNCELHAAEVKAFYEYLNNSMPNSDSMTAWDDFYAKNFEIRFGSQSITIENTAPIYEGIRCLLEEYINDCL